MRAEEATGSEREQSDLQPHRDAHLVHVLAAVAVAAAAVSAVVASSAVAGAVAGAQSAEARTEGAAGVAADVVAAPAAAAALAAAEIVAVGNGPTPSTIVGFPCEGRRFGPTFVRRCEMAIQYTQRHIFKRKG